MMASVAGVGQLLETVGVPVAQVGQASQDSKVPGQDFASAMQQAGGPSSQELARAAGGQDDAENGAPAAGSANGAVGAQGGNVKSASTKGIDAAVTLNRRSAVAGAARPLVAGARVVLADAAGSKQAATAPETATETATEISTAVAVDVPVGTNVAKEMTEAVSLSETDKSQQAAVQVPVPVRSLHGVVGASAKSMASGAAAAKASDGVTATGAKAAGPAVGLAGAESKLTAVVPQGMVEGAPVAVSATAPAALPVVVEAASAPVLSSDAVAVATASLPASVSGVPVSGGKAEGVKTAGPVASPVAVDPASATSVAAAGAQTFGKGTPGQGAFSTALNAAVPVATAAATAPIASTTGERMPATVAGAAQQAGEVVASSVLRAQGPANQVVANQVAANGAAVYSASTNQGAGSQAVVVGNGSLEQTGVSLQAALPATGVAEGAASKPGVHGGRSATVAVRSAADSAAGVGSAVVAGPAVGGAKAAPVSAVPVQAAVAVPAAHASAAVEGPKPGVKPGEGAAAPVQGAAVVAKGAASGEEVSTPAATAKSLGDAGHAVAAAQPAVLPVEQVLVTSVAITSVPVAHEAGAVTGSGATGGVVGSASAAGSTLGSAMGTQETAAAGLSHTTLSSSPTSLEVGVSNGTHGWLKIRAELNAAGEVNASLTGTSAAAAEKLRGDLPALNNYLQGEKLAIGTLDVRSALHTVLATSEGSATFSQSGSGQGSAGQQGANQGTNQGFGQASGGAVSADAGSAGNRSQQQNGSAVVALSDLGVDEVAPGRGSDAAVYASSMELGDNAGPSSVGYVAGGGWLNVRA